MLHPALWLNSSARSGTTDRALQVTRSALAEHARSRARKCHGMKRLKPWVSQKQLRDVRNVAGRRLCHDVVAGGLIVTFAWRVVKPLHGCV